MSEFEDRTRGTLDESLTKLDGRVRSRLTQARHAAIDELRHTKSKRRGGLAGWLQWLPLRALAPAGAMAAAAVVAVVLWSGRGVGPVVADSGAALEDMELLADGDALAVSADGDYEFYEWASAQDEPTAAERGT